MAAEFDYFDYVYESTVIEDYPVNWKRFMEIYLELYTSNRSTAAYRRYYQLVTELRGRPPQHAALWFCLYPNLMLEWYLEALAVSFLLPTSASTTRNVVDLYYPANIMAGHPEIVEAHQAAYGESAAEDRLIVERIDRGRRVLFEQGADDLGPYQQPLEDGMVHFHRWLRGQLAGRF